MTSTQNAHDASHAQPEGISRSTTDTASDGSDASQTPGMYAPPSAPHYGQHPYPPPGGAYPQYPPYPPQGYPQGYPGAHGYPGYPPPGVPGYSPPVGPYPQYPYPPPGQHHPPSPGGGTQGLLPPTGQYPRTPSPGQHPRTPSPGQYPLPPGAPPYQMMPTVDPNFPSASASSLYQPGYYPASPVSNQPLWYLGTAIPDPHAPAAPHGIEKVPGYDPAVTYNVVVKAVHGSNHTQLSSTLLPLDVFKMDALCDYAISKTGKSLQELVDKSGSLYSTTLRALTLGPLRYDVELVHKALAGMGTNEMLLTELIFCRSGGEIRLLIEGYRLKYGRDLVSAVKSDLSGKTERMFMMALNAQRPPDNLPVNYTEVADDIEILHHASKKKEEVPFFEVLINRSNPHLAAVITGFATQYKSLSKVIKQTFSGAIEHSLLYIVHGVKPKRDGQGFWRDAKLLEKSMAGMGTRDAQLVYRLVRAHWDPNRMEAIKDAYKRRYGKTLEGRVKGETSGDYQKLLVAIVRSGDYESRQV